MHDYILRASTPRDREALKSLWKTAFGDGDDYIDSFFENLWQPENAVVAEVGGEVVSAMYVLPEIALFPYRRKTLSGAYTYALATLPEYRGRGIGTAVCKAANDRALALADAACVLPAEPGLYPFYENASGAKALGCVKEARIPRDELAAYAPCMAARVPVLEYMGIRQQILSGLPHAAMGPEFYEHLEQTGTEFFVLEHGLAAAETADGVCRITELLDPDTDGMTSIAGVARWCRAEEYIVRSPLFFDGPGKRRSFVLAALRETPNFPVAEDLWWGFGLD